MENEKIEKLNEKLEKEFKELCEVLKTKTPEEIIERAYEITVKEELKVIQRIIDGFKKFGL